MFALHETTRRRWLRTGFLLFALFPSLAVVACAAWLRRPEYRELVAGRIGERLGLTVKLAAVRHPRPDVLLLEGVELADSESGAFCGRARLIEIDTADDQMTIVPSQAEIELADGAVWWRLAQDELRDTRPGASKLRLAAGELTIHMRVGQTPPSSQTLTDLRCQFDASEAGSQMGVSFRVAGQEMNDPATFSLVRNRQTTPATVGCEAHTGEASLPVGLFAAAWPAAIHLGPDARFRGSLRALQAPTGWEGEVSGELRDLDMNELVTNQFSHKLSGRGALRLEYVQFRADRIERASGALAVGPGKIGRTLLAAANESLGINPVGELKTLGRLAAYDKLAVGFVIDQHGLALRGQCPAGEGVVLEDRSGPLCKEPARASQPVVHLVSLLAPQSDAHSPTTRETSALAALLPLPALAPPAQKEEAPGPTEARLRVRAISPASR